jgi:soluble lytic murein transglycosylase
MRGNQGRHAPSWRWGPIRSIGFSLLFALFVSPLFARGADDARKPETAALPPTILPADASSVPLPQPLAPPDADRYRLIFGLQDQALWKAADRQIAKLADDHLLGHVLAQRYLNPGFRASYRQLCDWLSRFGALPEADDVYRLALKAKPKSVVAPVKPSMVEVRTGVPDNDLGSEGPDWLAGLTAWQSGDMLGAAAYFERVALDSSDSTWRQSAGAFWAARSYLKGRQPEKVSRWLRIAADRPRTFYGQLARRLLGLGSGFDFREQSLTANEAHAVMATGAGQRALALIQVGRARLAEDEMLALQAQTDASMDNALIAVSQLAELPTLSFSLAANAGARRAPWYDDALYPVPHWQPRGGFTVDRALLYALMRHESGFDPDARSPVGAAGLMQLMPDTAVLLGGRHQRSLYDPKINLSLGQDYVASLLANVRGNLFLAVAGYNAGPGNLAAWRDLDRTPDSLLFIENMPARETRQYVQRVMASYWIYQQRLGEPTTSLDAVASGRWPTYAKLDNAMPKVAANGAN